MDKKDMDDLKFHLSTSAPDNATILPATNVINNYWIGLLPFSRDNSMVVAVAVNSGDIKPEALSTATGLFFIGVEQGIFCANPETGSVITQITNLAFFQCFELIADAKVLVSDELEVLLFDATGHLVWRTGRLPDIVVKVEIAGHHLEVELFDGHSLQLSLETGRSVDINCTSIPEADI